MSNDRSNNEAPQDVSIGSFLWPLTLVAVGIYRLVRPGHSAVWSWTMIGVGSIFALLGLFAWRFASPKRAAANVHQLDRQLYAEFQERRIVDESTIRAYGLNLDFYTRTTEALRAMGFHELKDYVNVTVEQSWLKAGVVIRTFLSADGTAMSGIHDLRFGGFIGLLRFVGVLPRKLESTEFESELTDGTFVSTSNATLAGKTSEFPGVSRLFLPAETPPAALWAAHRDHVQRELARRGPDGNNVTAVVMQTFEDLIASQERMHLLKSRHRNSPDFDRAAEIARIAGKPLTTDQQTMADEAARLHREQMGSQ